MFENNVDYSIDNITIYRFCEYKCKYCWAWNLPIFVRRISRGRYDPVQKAKRYLHKHDRIIVVSFTSDPYPSIEEKLKLTRGVLEVLATNPKNTILILTKNPVLALRDIDIMNHGDMWLGTTIITLDDSMAKDWETKAPPPSQRISALNHAKINGVKTWLVIEPIIPGITYPERIIRDTIGYVDCYILGAFNHIKQLGFSFTKEQLSTWYEKHVKGAINLLESLNKKYYIKKELRKYL